MGKTKHAIIIVLSGPSGVGKDAVLSAMKNSKYPCYCAITATTRVRRKNEIDGVDYQFVSKKSFEEMDRNDEFLERASVYGNLYGVPKQPIRQALAANQDVIIKVDVQGAATIRNIVPEAVHIFLSPPSIEELQKRLLERKTERGTDLEIRMQKAQEEMKSLPLFGYEVVNETGGLEKAINEIQAIILAEKCRTSRRVVGL